ncbi:hypothetical protein WMY93_015551 [Mugilogobius chulae]|uniref:Tpd52 like 1 n=1 Tax=Mugilogobius chulae TaxID=88201 RepID=A0AAW0NV27_9GOBI
MIDHAPRNRPRPHTSGSSHSESSLALMEARDIRRNPSKPGASRLAGPARVLHLGCPERRTWPPLMETRQQELYSSILSEAVLDWDSMGPDGEWVNSDPHEGPQDRGHLGAGLLDSQPLREADEDPSSEINLSNSMMMTEEEREEIQRELAKLEEEISTLKQVLASKEKQHAELKEKLGLTPLSELRNNFSRGWQDMTNSTAYKKTSETLSTAGQKTTAAFSNLGTAITRKLGDMSLVGFELLFPRRSASIGYSIRQSMSMPTMRNSPSFKSFEEKVETTVSSIKTKVGGPGPGGSFEDVLSSAANASNQDTSTNNITPAAPEGSC